MHNHNNIDDALTHEGPDLADFVTTEELQQLIDGTLAPAPIVDRYINLLTTRADCTVTAPEDEMRADLLSFVRWQIERNVEVRAEEAQEQAMTAALTELNDHENAFIQKRATLIAKAQELGATKGAIANTLGISRPTLDKMLAEQRIRALFNDAIEYMTKPGTAVADYRDVLDSWFGDEWIDRYNSLLGIRNVREQAQAMYDITSALEGLPMPGLSAERAQLLADAREVAEGVLAARVAKA